MPEYTTPLAMINVRAMGATGNGSTDDRNAIQYAFDRSEGSPVFFPPGNYRIASQLFLDTKDYWLIGDRATITVSPTSTGVGSLERKHVIEQRTDTVPVTSFRCRGIKFVDQKLAGNGYWRAVIRIRKCGRTIIEDCEFQDVNNTCIQIGESSGVVGGTQGEIIVSKCKAWSSTPGTHVCSNFLKPESATHVLAIDNVISDYARAFSLEMNTGYTINSAIIARNLILNSKVGSESSTQTAIPLHVHAQNGSIGTVQLLGNTIRGTDMSGTASNGYEIMLQDATGTLGSFVCAGNLSDSCKLTGKQNFSYLALINSVADGVFEGNVFRNVLYSDSFAFTGETSDVITASGHNLTNDTPVVVSGGSLPTGLSAGTVYYVIGVSGNTFSLSTSVGGGAVDITGAGSGTINAIYRGLVVQNSNNILLRGNLIHGDFDRGIYLSAATNSLVSDNLLRGAFSSGGEIIHASSTGTAFTDNYANGSLVS